MSHTVWIYFTDVSGEMTREKHFDAWRPKSKIKIWNAVASKSDLPFTPHIKKHINHVSGPSFFLGL